MESLFKSLLSSWKEEFDLLHHDFLLKFQEENNKEFLVSVYSLLLLSLPIVYIFVKIVKKIYGFVEYHEKTEEKIQQLLDSIHVLKQKADQVDLTRNQLHQLESQLKIIENQVLRSTKCQSLPSSKGDPTRIFDPVSVVSSVPSVNDSLSAPLTPPAPPPPPAPMSFGQSEDPLGALKQKLKSSSSQLKRVNTDKPSDSKDESSQPSMTDVLKELSQVQKKVMVMIQSPRQSYLEKKTSFTNNVYQPSPLRRQLHFTEFHQENDTCTSSNNHLSLPTRESKRFRTSSPLKTEVNGVLSNHNQLLSPTRMMRPLANVTDRLYVNAENSLNPLSYRNNYKLDSGIPKLKTKEEIAPNRDYETSEKIKKELPHVTLRRTNLPRSPGGTTLIPIRKTYKKTKITWADHIESTLRQKFSNFISSDDETENESF